MEMIFITDLHLVSDDQQYILTKPHSIYIATGLHLAYLNDSFPYEESYQKVVNASRI